MLPYRAILAHHGVRKSMSRRGNCFENAVIESFFGTLKAEYSHLVTPEGIATLEAGVHELHPLLQPRANQARAARTQPGGILAEAHRLIGKIATVQLLRSVQSPKPGWFNRVAGRRRSGPWSPRRSREATRSLEFRSERRVYSPRSHLVRRIRLPHRLTSSEKPMER